MAMNSKPSPITCIGILSAPEALLLFNDLQILVKSTLPEIPNQKKLALRDD